ncbi:hypothetical protein [Paenibacillus thiaminolyticus]|nr:hypothetical protein [Paenibacillus thiaminolyticus]
MVQKWFEEAKLVIFIHYGIYAVSGMDPGLRCVVCDGRPGHCWMPRKSIK